MDIVTVQAWEDVAMRLVSLGVTSFGVLKGAMLDAGVDDQTVTDLQVKWDVLVADVKRASER